MRPQFTNLKKIAAILLIIILFFNWYGFKIISAYLQKDADYRLEARLDKNDYDESQLMEIRIALNMPYQNSQSEFERHYGEIELDGKYYTYVKRKIENGYLILQCIPNNSKQELQSASNEFLKITYGLDQNQQDKKQNSNSSVAKNFWSVYDDHSNRLDIDIISNRLNSWFKGHSTSLYHIWQSTPEQPPENRMS